MTANLNEETRLDGYTKTYLEMYQEFLEGYKQYKMEKATFGTEVLLEDDVELFLN